MNKGKILREELLAELAELVLADLEAVTESVDLWEACHCCLCGACVPAIETEEGLKFRYHDKPLEWPRYCEKCDLTKFSPELLALVEKAKALCKK